MHLETTPFHQSGCAESSALLQGIAYFSRSHDSDRMESKKPEWPEEALGLRLVRSFLLLPPEKRQLVLDLVEELLCKQSDREKGSDAKRP